MSDDTILISAKHVYIKAPHRNILDNISLTLKRGEITTLIGPNGAGKTTLIKALLGLIQVDKGDIYTKPSLRIGYMPQKLNIETTMPLSVERFWRLGLDRGKKFDQSLLDLLGLCEVEHLRHKALSALSGGEMQRVLLARALINRPQLLVLDEPVQGVDMRGQIHMYELINQLRQQLDCAVLMISHDLHLVASATDQVVCLNQHICCSGSPAKISQDPMITQLFGHEGAQALALYNHHSHHQACHHE